MKNPYAIELAFPDIAPYRKGNTAIEYVHSFDSGRSGPHVMVNALTHGNEVCGAITLDQLFRQGLRPAKGTLTLSFANVEAYARFSRDDPSRGRYVDEDFNRVWTDEVLAGPRDSAELRRARQLRPLVAAADFLLDIHSMHERCRPVMVCGLLDKGVAFAREVGIPEFLIVDQGHPSGRRMRDYGGFGDPSSPKNALLIECGQHWEASSAEIAMQTTLRFLRATGVVDEAFIAPRLGSAPRIVQRVVRVTDAVVASSTDFRFAGEYHGLEVIARRGTVIAWSDGKPVETPYDDCVLVMPSLTQLKPGVTVVRLGRIEG